MTGAYGQYVVPTTQAGKGPRGEPPLIPPLIFKSGAVTPPACPQNGRGRHNAGLVHLCYFLIFFIIKQKEKKRKRKRERI